MICMLVVVITVLYRFYAVYRQHMRTTYSVDEQGEDVENELHLL